VRLLTATATLRLPVRQLVADGTLRLASSLEPVRPLAVSAAATTAADFASVKFTGELPLAVGAQVSGARSHSQSRSGPGYHRCGWMQSPARSHWQSLPLASQFNLVKARLPVASSPTRTPNSLPVA